MVVSTVKNGNDRLRKGNRRRRTRTTHGIFTVASEKNRELLFIGYILQTVTSLRVVLLVFRGYDLLKIANINPQQAATLSLWKKLVPRKSGGNEA